MPKDNEVDEKVEDFFERLYGMTFRLYLDPNSEEDEGNTVELRLGATVSNLALFETQDHAVLHTAATVAELRAEVERLRGRVAQLSDVIGEKELATEDECQVHRAACFELSEVLIRADVLEIIHDGGTDAAWKNIIESVKSLTGADPT